MSLIRVIKKDKSIKEIEAGQWELRNATFTTKYSCSRWENTRNWKLAIDAPNVVEFFNVISEIPEKVHIFFLGTTTYKDIRTFHFDLGTIGSEEILLVLLSGLHNSNEVGDIL